MLQEIEDFAGAIRGLPGVGELITMVELRDAARETLAVDPARFAEPLGEAIREARESPLGMLPGAITAAAVGAIDKNPGLMSRWFDAYVAAASKLCDATVAAVALGWSWETMGIARRQIELECVRPSKWPWLTGVLPAAALNWESAAIKKARAQPAAHRDGGDWSRGFIRTALEGVGLELPAGICMPMWEKEPAMSTHEMTDVNGDWGSARYEISGDGLVLMRFRVTRPRLLLDDVGRHLVDTLTAAVPEIVGLLADAGDPEIETTDETWQVRLTGHVPVEAPDDWRDQLAAEFRSLLAIAKSLPEPDTNGGTDAHDHH